MDGFASTSYGTYMPTYGVHSYPTLSDPPEAGAALGVSTSFPPPPPPAEAPPPLPESAPPPLSPRSERRSRARRTVSVQDVLPTVGTEDVLYSAFAQFGRVEDVYIFRSHTDASRDLQCIGTALVRFNTEEQARKVIQETTEKLYMVGGMPRPIISCIADEKQLELEEGDRAEEPAPLQVRVLDKASDDMEIAFATRFNQMYRRQQAERELLKKMNSEKERELAERQAKVFKEIYEKYELVRKINASQGVEQLKKVLSGRR